jgi:hypothetical protein
LQYGRIEQGAQPGQCLQDRKENQWIPDLVCQCSPDATPDTQAQQHGAQNRSQGNLVNTEYVSVHPEPDIQGNSRTHSGKNHYRPEIERNTVAGGIHEYQICFKGKTKMAPM